MSRQISIIGLVAQQTVSSHKEVIIDQFPRDILAQWAAQHTEILALYVFGSRARGAAGDQSDLDLAVEIDDERESELTVLIDNRSRWLTVLSELTGLCVRDIYLVSDKEVSGAVIEVFRRGRR